MKVTVLYTLVGRRVNEDIKADVSLFAIYDGYGGTTPLDRVCDNMAEHVVQALQRTVTCIPVGMLC